MQSKQIQFPSFAPSFNSSPKGLHDICQSSTFQSLQSPEVQKISIHLPEQFLQQSPQAEMVQSKIRSSTQRQSDVERSIENDKSQVLVYCRMRQPSKSQNSIKYDSTMADTGEMCYSFDQIFGKFATQKQLYQRIANRHIDDFFMGKNSTIFAYGQTGSGKTYTMFGDMSEPQQYGIIPRTLQQIFKRDLSNSTITCSMVEIYNEKLMDLFNPLTNSYKQIKMKQYNDMVYLQGLQQILVQNEQELLNLIKLGHKGRKIAATRNNDLSSRSHTILFVYRNFMCKDQEFRCKLCLIDLAGSEKVRKSGVIGQTLEEAKKINLSLSCLGNVVHALTNGSDHIPYRNSKLTRILKDSLSSNTNTSIITTCSLQKSDFQQTLSTIKFAVRAKKIKNKKKLNNEEVSMQEQLVQLKKQLEQTKKQLADYKLRQQQQKIVDIPEEEVDLQPLKCLSFTGGLSSRVNLINTIVSQ